MTSYIIDTCVAVKWYYQEDYRLEALQYLNCDADLIAPDCIQQEFANTIIKKIQSKNVTKELGWQTYTEVFHNNVFTLIPTGDLIEQGFIIATEINHSLYDSIFLAAAIKNQSIVVTADMEFIKRVRKHHKYASYVKWIEEPFNS